MKSLRLKTVLMLCLIGVGFMMTTPFSQRAEANHDPAECAAWDAACAAAWGLVEYYCYSSAWNPSACNSAWAMLGSTCSTRDIVCRH